MEQSRATGSSSSSNVFDLKRCFVSLVDIRSNANILNMFPTSLAEETSKNKKDTCVKLGHMHTPTKGFLKNKEEENKENLDSDFEESSEDSEVSSDPDDPSYESSEDSEASSDPDDPSYTRFHRHRTCTG